MITGVVLARNEQRNIVACLERLRPHVEEVVLIDMQSEDRTVELARPLADQILSHDLIPHFDAARNIAIPAAKYDWLWFVDAKQLLKFRSQLASSSWSFLTNWATFRPAGRAPSCSSTSSGCDSPRLSDSGGG